MASATAAGPTLRSLFLRHAAITRYFGNSVLFGDGVASYMLLFAHGVAAYQLPAYLFGNRVASYKQNSSATE